MSIEEDIVEAEAPKAVGIVYVIVEEAQGIPKMDKFSHTDAYAQVQVEDFVEVTKIIRDTENPAWQHKFQFEVMSRDSKLRVMLFDHDPIDKDDEIAEVVTNFKEPHVATTPELGVGEEPHYESKWFPLQEVEGGPKAGPKGLGKVRLQLAFEEFVPDYEDVSQASEDQTEAPEQPNIPTGDLTITIIEARGLPKMDLFGKNDVFCVLTVGDMPKEHTSTVDGGGASPAWNNGSGETLHFKDVKVLPGTILILDLEDQDNKSSDHIGHTTENLDELIAKGDGFSDEWCELTGNNDKTAGQLHVVLRWVRHGAAEKQAASEQAAAEAEAELLEELEDQRIAQLEKVGAQHNSAHRLFSFACWPLPMACHCQSLDVAHFDWLNLL